MKKIIFISLALFSCAAQALAPIPTRLAINVSHLPASKTYFLCLYGSGCYNLHTSLTGKTFPLNLQALTNIKKVFVADVHTRRMYPQSTSDSCNKQLVAQKNIQKVTFTGKLIFKNHAPYIANLHCITS